MRVALALMIVATLAGCVRLGGKPPRELLTLTASATLPAGQMRRVASSEALTVMTPSAVPPIAAARIPVYQGNEAVAYIEGAVLADTAARQFARLLGETIGARTGRVVLDLRQSTAAGGQRLQGTLQRFGIEETGARAVIVYDALLVRGDGTLLTRRFEARAPATAIEARPAAVALNTAANDVAVQVADWVGTVQP